MNFEERVLKHEIKLNDTDDEIIDFIRKNKTIINIYSIQDVAKQLYIVPNAIMRLAKKLEYKGFSEMKILITNESEDIITKSKIPKNVMRSIELIDNSILHKVAIKFKYGKTVHFIGVGDSLYYCEMMSKNLKCLNKKAEFYQGYHDSTYCVKKCDKQDILFFISARGNNERLIQLAKLGKQRGLFIISATHFSKNALSSIADISLYFWGELREVSGYNVTDRSGLMILLRALSEEFWRNYCV